MLQIVLVPLIVTILVFLMVRLLPGDPILMYMTQQNMEILSQEQIDVIRHDLGLDRSLAVQYVDWLSHLAGYFGGLVYSIIMRFVDALMAFPAMLLTLSIVALLGGGMHMVIVALGIGMMTGYARVMCAQAISIKENDYVLAARSLGSSSWRMMVRHVLPNAFPPMIVMMTIMIGSTILAEAGLSYLGIGIKEPTVAWGSMVNDGYKWLLTNPLLSLAPGLAIIIVVYAFNMVGDGLRDALDPRLRGTL